MNKIVLLLLLFGFEVQANETVNLFQIKDTVKSCCTSKIPSRYGIKKAQPKNKSNLTLTNHEGGTAHVENSPSGGARFVVTIKRTATL